ncbi:RNA-binding protein C23E6.01c [Musa troglodytarum]|uniref:Purple acid phosphatase n=1 Tax=Musa troglodytarum TaxID=320322 RepID=A0A9E7GJX8_9LILI|nr:RNA-binding protein C23E6.01c [Musa troglodytarum]
MMQPAGGMVQPPPMDQQPQQQQWMMMPPPPPQPQYYQAAPAPPMWNQQPSQVPPPVSQTVPQPPQQYQAPTMMPPSQMQYQAAPAPSPAQPLGPQPASADEIRTLWIGGLQFWMDENYLYSCFVHTGEVVSVKIIRNKQSGQSEGYGFIEFVSHAGADRILQTYNGQVMPNTEQAFRLNWATCGAGERRGDGVDYTIFVGDLAADVTDYLLQETFKNHYSSVKGAKVVTDRLTGRSKGYGFVKFGDPNEQTRAMTEMNGIYCSTRPMRIGPAADKKSLGTQQQYPSNASYQTTQSAESENDPNNTTIFVGGLDPNVTDDHLRQVFSPYGEIVYIKIPVGKRCGFVQFANRANAEEALQMLNGTLLGGQNVRLSWGRSPTNKQPQQDPNQWNGNYYGYTQSYDAYGYAPPQDPNMYAYATYPGYGNYQQQQPPQQPPQISTCVKRALAHKGPVEGCARALHLHYFAGDRRWERDTRRRRQRRGSDGAECDMGCDSSVPLLPLFPSSIVDGDRRRERGGLRPAVASENPKSPVEAQAFFRSPAGTQHMRITWVSDDEFSRSIVEYGTSPGEYTSSSQGESTFYKYLLYSSGKINHVVIGPLESNTVYFYRCGGQGPEFQFRTPPSEFPVTFSVVGDLGQTGWTKSTLDHISQCKYDVHLLPGDLSYADYQQHLWDSFGALVQPLASSRPWMVTEGNHEKESIVFFKSGFQAYNARWKMPYEESGSTSNLYYSFEVAGVHIIMLGSYADYDENSDQYAWLKTDLARIDRERTPWLLVLLHVPWYNSNWAHQGEGKSMMAAMEPLLYAAGVDIFIAGHVHAYERMDRVYHGGLDPCGPLHITIGDGGNREGLAQRYFHPKPEWSVFREASFGHGELKIVNSTHAIWSWHRNDDDESVKSDEVWINSLASTGCILENRPEYRKILMSP